MSPGAGCIDPDLAAAARRAGDAIMHAGLKAVTAESCTAGLIAAALSEVPGASCFLEAGFVVYAKSSKTRLLGVDEKLLQEKTSVSSEVAEQMARGALERSGATLALAVTGVLGPEPDEDGNPVGLVYLSVRTAGKPPVTKRFMHAPHSDRAPDPDRLRQRVTLDCLGELRVAALQMWATGVARPSGP